MVRHRKKLLLAAMSIVLGIGLLYGVVVALTDRISSRRYRRAYPEIRIGDSRDVVTNLMGKPSHIDNCDYAAFPDLKTDLEYRRTCVHQYWYEVFLKDYIISFDKEGRVIAKSDAVSP